MKPEHDLRTSILVAGLTAFASGFMHPAAALPPCCEQKLTASDGAATDSFGYSVSISRDVAIVGARWDDDKGAQSGSGYVYRYDGVSWQEQKLTALDGAAEDWFGQSVSISGDVAIVGARWDDDDGTNSGSAYVYRYDGVSWQEQKLTASDGAANDWFGFAVSISGDVAIVGAPFDDDNGGSSGSAYVYRYDGVSWQEQKLTASDGAATDRFGYAVAISGDVAIVGARWDDDNGTDSGSAYVYRYDGVSWQEEKLTAADGVAGDFFGFSVSISGDMAIVGAPLDDDNGDSSGSAYVYGYDGVAWQEQKLTASDGATGEQSGFSVAISGDAAIVGAPFDDDNGASSGSAYVFRHDGVVWQERKLTAPDGEAGDEFGWSVSISEDVAIVGALGDDDNGTDSGSVYVYNLVYDGADVNRDGAVDTLDLVEVILAWGPCVDCAADVTGDGFVDVLDLVQVVLAWGPCA